ncbi:MAG: hypothetical protein OXJ90_27610 [Spirochaetaceae bacterium]|nr:hypothetical protein [Spirochaetaceae bacterium]
MTAVLKSGYGTYRCGRQAIRIGPGSGVHYHWEMRESEPGLDSFRVLITLQTPVDRTSRSGTEPGRWQPAPWSAPSAGNGHPLIAPIITPRMK